MSMYLTILHLCLIYWPCISEIKTDPPPFLTQTPLKIGLLLRKIEPLKNILASTPNDAWLFVQFINLKIFVYLNFGINKLNKIIDDFDGDRYQH